MRYTKLDEIVNNPSMKTANAENSRGGVGTQIGARDGGAEEVCITKVVTLQWPSTLFRRAVDSTMRTWKDRVWAPEL